MAMTGGCYCGELRYEISGNALFAGQCHCRECQYITGGGPNFVMAFADGDFTYTKGTPATFSRTDLENPVTREFCGTCGTAMGSRAPSLPGAFIAKVGTLDDPSTFKSTMAIFTIDKQGFHHIPDDIPAFERSPS